MKLLSKLHGWIWCQIYNTVSKTDDLLHFPLDYCNANEQNQMPMNIDNSTI